MIGALLLQSASAAPPPVPICTLVTPGGQIVGFHVMQWDSSGNLVGVIATDNSVWPQRTLVGQRIRDAQDSRSSGRFSFGGSTGLILELSTEAERPDRPVVALYRRDNPGVPIPVAYGRCQLGRQFDVYAPFDHTADPNAVGAEIPAFDPARWPDDHCALLLDDGRRTRVNYTLRQGASRVEIASPDLWGGRPVSARMTWMHPRPGAPNGAFARRGGPTGTEQFVIDGERGLGAKLIRFLSLGDPSATSHEGFAICGYRGIVRRTSFE